MEIRLPMQFQVLKQIDNNELYEILYKLCKEFDAL